MKQNNGRIPLKVIRKLKYISDQAGIFHRYINERTNWDSHLTRCKEFIEGCLQDKNIGTVAILGSGWLLDVPVEFMAARFPRIYLYDIFHPRQVIHKLNTYGSFEFVTADLTGMAGKVFDIVRTFRKEKIRPGLQELDYPVFTLSYEADYVISLNILNQLDILLADYLKENGVYSDEELVPFRQALQTAHINCLPAGRSCLITDYEELVYDPKDFLLERKALLYASIPSGGKISRWEWVFDTTGSYNKNCRTVFNVLAQEL